jgi:hypothetical protein
MSLLIAIMSKPQHVDPCCGNIASTPPNGFHNGRHSTCSCSDQVLRTSTHVLLTCSWEGGRAIANTGGSSQQQGLGVPCYSRPSLFARDSIQGTTTAITRVAGWHVEKAPAFARRCWRSTASVTSAFWPKVGPTIGALNHKSWRERALLLASGHARPGKRASRVLLAVVPMRGAALAKRDTSHRRAAQKADSSDSHQVS